MKSRRYRLRVAWPYGTGSHDMSVKSVTLIEFDVDDDHKLHNQMMGIPHEYDPVPGSRLSILAQTVRVTQIQSLNVRQSGEVKYPTQPARAAPQPGPGGGGVNV